MAPTSQNIGPHQEPTSSPPVFFLVDEAPQGVTVVDICSAAEDMIGFGTIFGAQRMGQLWRLYPISLEARAKLLLVKLTIKGMKISLKSQNPFSSRDSYGKEVPTTRLTIDNVYVSVASIDIEAYLLKAGVTFRSPIIYEKSKLENGKLSR